MIKTYEIDLEDSLVDESSEIFEELGTDIDTAIKLFLKQSILRKGFPFELVIPEEEKASEGEREEPAPEVEPAPVREEPAPEAEPDPVREEPAPEAISAPVREEPAPEAEPAPVREEPAPEAESDPVREEPALEDDSEDEDESTPENLFDAWGK